MPIEEALMKSSISSKLIVAAALAIAGFAAASAAHARSDVYLSIGVQGAPVYVEPAPVYVQPRPVHVQPRPLYVQLPVYVAPAEVYERSGPPVYDNYYEDNPAWRRGEWRWRHWKHHRHDWDQHQSRGRDWD